MSLSQPSNTYLVRSNVIRGIDAVLYGATFFVPQKPNKLVVPISHPEVAAFVERHGFFSIERPLVGRVTRSEKDIGMTAEFLEKLPSYIDDPEMLQIAEGEILSKVLAYRELKTGMAVGRYTVDAVFDLWQGMPAFGLLSAQGPALLLFRGTDLNLRMRRAWASVWSDLDLKGPGCSVYQKARPKLRQWLKGKSARAIGCSLGGALTAYAALFDSDLLSSSYPSLAFNPPGVFKHRAKLWSELAPKPLLITYTTTGDFIPKVGRLIGEVREISAARRLKPIEAHVKLMFAEK
jgi:hypothetical protein